METIGQKIRRIYVEKKEEAGIESKDFFEDLRNNLMLTELKGARVLNCYDVLGASDELFDKCITNVFTEPPVDNYFLEAIGLEPDETAFGVQYLPGQYDQRADWAEQAIKAIMPEIGAIKVYFSKIYVLKGDLKQGDIDKVKVYVINPVDSMEVPYTKPDVITEYTNIPCPVKEVSGFISMSVEELSKLRLDMGLAMSLNDLMHCQAYFKDDEKRRPTITEIRVLDTYWSDHCRHTTFNTCIEDIKIEDGNFTKPVKEAFKLYQDARKEVYGDKERKISLMDIATMGMKLLKKRGILNNLDESEEINACSIQVKVDVDGKDEDWLVMFKNETHNHPTEIEPFGGAATCLGGAIRDPLSGRAYVYQAMRVTGSADPRTPVSETIPGKLPQRKITIGAASGYSSYGNQIGLATGQVNEIYDEGYLAKRMEVGAVIGAVPKSSVVREAPAAGDVVILLGGRTGRDGCGGATGSSKAHTDASITQSGAEVQKGNPPTERNIQRLFRRPEVTRLIKRCNDFGAGGVSVAVGELADGLNINLDKILKKYDSLDGTELAISESQERMAVVVNNTDADKFIEMAAEENLEAVVVALVTDNRRLIMNWRGDAIVNISRDFLDTNGAQQQTDVKVTEPKEPPFKSLTGGSIKERWLNNLKDLNVCAQKGLAERFDSTIGAGTVLMPFGGKYQLTPALSMAAKIPVVNGETSMATLMAYGYDPKASRWSPFHGAMYAVIESVSKIVASGGNPKEIKLTFQEYFERLGDDSARWGKPFSALLGAFMAQLGMGLAAIGGKDSMSGSFNDLDVPPALISFGVCPVNVKNIISPEFKNAGNSIAILSPDLDFQGMPDFDKLNAMFAKVHESIKKGHIISAHTIGYGGIGAALSKMAFGNRIGFDVMLDENTLFEENYCGFVFELKGVSNAEFEKEFAGFNPAVIGVTSENSDFSICGIKEIEHIKALRSWLKPLESVFPTKLLLDIPKKDITVALHKTEIRKAPSIKTARPRVFIPVFPGTNCEYDTKRAFDLSGADTEVFVIRNITSSDFEESIKKMAEHISKSQIVALAGGFSAGDEPDGSGKFIAAMMKNSRISEALNILLNKNDGLMLGICNGFQALIKLGLVPYGKITDMTEDSPTLSFNAMGRHISLIVNTKIISDKSPWFMLNEAGQVHKMAVSHGEGRFLASEAMVNELARNGQIATQYVDLDGEPANSFEFNPNGSMYAVEGITSPDGRILGKMGHTERAYRNEFKNVPGDYSQRIFEAGVKYFS